MRRAPTALTTTKIQIRVRHVSTHVGVYDNEKVNRLTKAAVEKDTLGGGKDGGTETGQALEALADSIIVVILNR